MDYRIDDASSALDYKIEMVNKNLSNSFKNLKSYTEEHFSDLNSASI